MHVIAKSGYCDILILDTIKRRQRKEFLSDIYYYYSEHGLKTDVKKKKTIRHSVDILTLITDAG